MQLIVLSILFTWMTTQTVCQIYRNPMPVETLPFDSAYEEDYTESYDYLEHKNIHRWNVDDFPHPEHNYRFCNRMQTSYVCDPDEVLKRDEADKLDSFILDLYKETPCICDECQIGDKGIIVGIAVLKNLFQPYNQHPSKTIRSFAERLRKNWKLGQCDNDILIVLATTDRLSYTDVGKSTAYYVSLNEAHRIFLENKAHFSAGHFYEGLRDMLAAYHQNTRNMKSPVKKELDIAMIAGSIVGAIALLGIILFAIFAIYRQCKKRKDPEKAIEGIDEPDHKSEGVASSWTKKDIRVLFNSMKSTNDKHLQSSTKYQPCDTEEKDVSCNEFTIGDEVIDTTLALPDDSNETQITSVDDSSTPEMLDKELAAAVEDIAQTFKPNKKPYNGHQTEL